MLNQVANILIILGIAILLGCLPPVRKLLKLLPRGPLRFKWTIMGGLILVFILGYLGYACHYRKYSGQFSELIVPSVFFLGACFVWLSCMLSLQTIQDGRRLARLEQENITDPLSGVYNRRYLDRRLEEEYARSERTGQPLCILLMDIDNFKQVNDTFGHPAGDQILGKVGKLAQGAIRISDILARYGGDEFVIVSPNTSLEMGRILAERLRQHIDVNPLMLEKSPSGPQEIHLRVSIGVSMNGPGVDIPALIQNADQAMYCAKMEGRNRVVLYPGDCLPEGSPPPPRSKDN